MIEESAKVNAVHSADGTITVEVQRQSTCGSCSVRKGCGSSVIAKALGQRRTLLRINYCKQDLQVGDTVTLGLSESALIKGSLAVYTIPLLLMLGSAILGDFLSRQFLIWDADRSSVVFALFGLTLGVMWLKRFTRSAKDNAQYQPVVLRKQTLNVINS